MQEDQRLDYQQRVSDLAEQILDQALANGEAFSEGLCNWAISQAEQKTPMHQGGVSAQ